GDDVESVSCGCIRLDSARHFAVDPPPGDRGHAQGAWELSASAMALASRRSSATRRSTRDPVTRSAMEAIDRAARGRDPRIRRGAATAHELWANRPGLWTKPSMRA